MSTLADRIKELIEDVEAVKRDVPEDYHLAMRVANGALAGEVVQHKAAILTALTAAADVERLRGESERMRAALKRIHDELLDTDGALAFDDSRIDTCLALALEILDQEPPNET